MEFNEQMANLRQLYESKEYSALISQAIVLLDETEDPPTIDFYFLLAKTYLAIGEYDDAQYYFLKTKTEDPSKTEALFSLVNIKITLKEYYLALDYTQEILDKEPSNLKAQILLADLYLHLKQVDKALELYQNLLEKTSDKSTSDEIRFKTTSLLYREQRLEEALKFINESPTSEFNEPLEVLRYQIFVALGSPQRQQLIDSAKHLYENRPNNPSYLINLAQLLSDLNDQTDLYTKALALELNEDQKKLVWSSRAYNCILLKDWALALEDYNNLIQVEQKVFYYKKRAVAKEALKDIKGAIQDLSLALKMNDTIDVSIQKQRGLLFQKAKLYDKAIADFTSCLNLNKSGNNSELYYNLGIAHSKKGDKKNTVAMLLQADKHNHPKATQFLLKNYPSQLEKVRAKKAQTLENTYKQESTRNQESPILSKAFDKLWKADMPKFITSSKDELLNFPASITKMVLDKLSKEIFLITPKGLLFFEGDSATPLEAYYSVELESEHAIILNIQPTKGGASSTMKISLYEDNLLLNYPITEEDTPPKYYLAIDKPNLEDLTRLQNKAVDIPYIDTIEKAILQLPQS